MTDEQEPRLKDEMKAIRVALEKLVETGVAKKSKVPFKARLGKSMANKGYVTIQLINENLSMEFYKLPIDEMTTVVKDCPRLATPEHILTYKGMPWIIQPAWSVRPFSPTENYEQANKDKMLAAGYRLLVNRIEQGDVKMKKKISGGLIFAIIIGVIVVGYFVIKGFG